MVTLVFSTGTGYIGLHWSYSLERDAIISVRDLNTLSYILLTRAIPLASD